MNIELTKILSDLKELIEAWNTRKIPKENEFITDLTALSSKLAEELKNVQKPQQNL